MIDKREDKKKTSRKNTKGKTYTCVFCGKTTKDPIDHIPMIVSDDDKHAVCFNCLSQCVALAEYFDEEEKTVNSTNFVSKMKVPKPNEIKEFLDNYVVGQDRAKIALAVAVYNHYKKVKNNIGKGSDVELEKSNILLIGESGSGKTLLAKTLAKMLDVPFCVCDATTYTEAGYVGEDVENCIQKLLQVADGDVAKAECGICVIDEVDKLVKKTPGQSTTRDVSGEGVQQAFLKLLEGSEVNVSPKNGGRKRPDENFIKVNTKNILFILAGSFVGLEKQKERKIAKSGHLGFDNIQTVPEEKKSLDYDVEDIIEYGFIPEFAGRVPVVVSLDKLTEDDFKRILVEPKNSIVAQFKQLFKMDKVKLDFTDDALTAIAHKAFERKTGARGLRTIMEKMMMKRMYEIPTTKSKNLTITSNDVESSIC